MSLEDSLEVSRRLLVNKLILLLILSFSINASEMEEILIDDLQEVVTLKKRYDNNLLKLMNDASVELKKSWSDKLAKELARVYTLVIKKNKNYFIVDVFKPVLENEKFKESFKQNLKKEDYEHFLQSVKDLKREKQHGNG